MEITARPIIPASWAEQGICPVCQHKPLRLDQEEGAADLLACFRCGSAFELEHGGDRVRFRRLTGPLRIYSSRLLDQWLTRSDLVLVLNAARQAHLTDLSSGGNPSQAVDSSLWNREEPQFVSDRESQGGKSSDSVKTGARSSTQDGRGAKKASRPFFLWLLLILAVSFFAAAVLIFPDLRSLALTVFQRGTATALAPTAGTAPAGLDLNPLPADGKAYFEIVWNLKGNYDQRSQQLQTGLPPLELAFSHNLLKQSYTEMAAAEGKENLLLFQLQTVCGYPQVKPTDQCRSLNADFVNAHLARVQSFSRLSDMWNSRAVPAWEEYFRKVNVPLDLRKADWPEP